MAPAAAVYAVQRESLGRYIRERKLLLAARDLRESDARVYDICLRYGFDSQQTFTRIFTRTFNQPPGAYRKRTIARHINMSRVGRVRRSRPGFFVGSVSVIPRSPAIRN